MNNPQSTDLYGRVMLSIEGTSLLSHEKDLISNPHVGGIIFFARNFISREQINSLCDEVLSIKRNIVIAVDQEGGRVQRFNKEFTKLPSMQQLGDYVIKNNDYEICHDVGWLMSSELLASGIDISFAPVLDVDRDTSSIIGDRAFSDDPNLVTALAKHFIDGMNAAGMQATGKHFPGHGGIFEDSHITEPTDSRNYLELSNKDIKPFVELKDHLAAVMSAHIVFPEVDDVSVGFSSKWLKDILRQEIKFNGIVFSDDLSMKGSGNEKFSMKSIKSIEAGCDMVLVCNDFQGASEVVRCFEKENMSLSKKIGIMKKSKSPTWNDLVSNEKRLKTLEVLKKIGD